MKTNNLKLDRLHKYFAEGGSTDPEDVMAVLKTEDEAVMQAYIAELRKRYPDVYGGDTDEAETSDEDETYTYFLKEDGLPLKELELTRQKGNKLFFSVVEPKDLVTVMIKGEPVKVDLIQLAKYPGDSPHGVLNSKLIELAQLARG